MDFLILVKHSQSLPQPEIPASEWHLSDRGRKRCRILAGRLTSYRPSRLYSSTEPKAIETGRLLSNRLGLRCEPAEGLHEHRRQNVGLLTEETFEEAVKIFFEHPDELVFGEETAVQAQARFHAAVDELLSGWQSDSVVVVAHGTVISLFVAECAGLDPYELWRNLELPSYVVLSLPERKLIEVVGSIESD